MILLPLILAACITAPLSIDAFPRLAAVAPGEMVVVYVEVTNNDSEECEPVDVEVSPVIIRGHSPPVDVNVGLRRDNADVNVPYITQLAPGETLHITEDVDFGPDPEPGGSTFIYTAANPYREDILGFLADGAAVKSVFYVAPPPPAQRLVR